MDYLEQEKIAHKKFNTKIYHQRIDVKRKNNERNKKYRREHPEKAREIDRRHYYAHRSERIATMTLGNNKPCRDPVLNDTVRYNTLIARMRNHPELYEGIRPRDCIIHIPKIRGLDLLSDEQKEQLNLN